MEKHVDMLKTFISNFYRVYGKELNKDLKRKIEQILEILN